MLKEVKTTVVRIPTEAYETAAKIAKETNQPIGAIINIAIVRLQRETFWKEINRGKKD